MAKNILHLLLFVSCFASAATIGVSIPTRYAEAEGSAALAIAVAEVGTTLIDGNVDSAILDENRNLLVNLHGRLSVAERQLDWLQRVLVRLPDTIRTALDDYDARQRIDRIRASAIALQDLEERFRIERDSGLALSHFNHFNHLQQLYTDLRNDIRALSVKDHLLLLPTRAAAFAFAVQVLTDIIALQKLILSLGSGNDDLIRQLGFHNKERLSRQLAANRQERLLLVQTARDDMSRLLFSTMLDYVGLELRNLHDWQRCHGHLDLRFPRLPRSNLQDISAGIRKISEVISKSCKGPEVRNIDTRLRRWIFRDGVAPHRAGNLTGLHSSLSRLERDCDLESGTLLDLAELPFYTKDRDIGHYLYSFSGQMFPENEFLRRFRTVTYRNHIGTEIHRASLIENLIGSGDTYTHSIRRSQYEIEIDTQIVDRPSGRIPWRQNSWRVPGLRQYEMRPDTNHPPEFKPSARQVLPMWIVWRNFGNYNFNVSYIRARNILQGQPNAVTRHYVNPGSSTCFGSLRNLRSAPAEAVMAVVEEVTKSIEQKAMSSSGPLQQLFEGDHCSAYSGGAYGIPLGPQVSAIRQLRDRSAGGGCGSDVIWDLDEWVKGSNAHRAAVEFVFRVYALIERSYLAFDRFLYDLEEGNDPEVVFAVRADLLVSLLEDQPGNTEFVDFGVELSDHRLLSEEARLQAERTILAGEERIARERERALWGARLRLALLAAETAWQYGFSSEIPEGEEVPDETEGLGDGEGEFDTGEEVVLEFDLDQEDDRQKFHELIQMVEDPETVTESSRFELVNWGAKGAYVVAKKGARKILTWKIVRQAGNKGRFHILRQTHRLRSLFSGEGGKVTLVVKAARSRVMKANETRLLQALKKKKKYVEFDRSTTPSQVDALAKKWLCAGLRKCTALFRLPEKYEGYILRRGDLQFRLGQKISEQGKKVIEANFENIAKGINVHYVLM